MKKILASFLLALFAVQSAYAAPELPTSSVWFEPATAVAGETITLNALVYNNQAVDATVTVVFSSPAGNIGTTATTIPKATAKTVSAPWKMPADNTVVTATVSTAVDGKKKSLPGLVGVLDTVTVGSTMSGTSGSDILGMSFPGSTQLKAWFGPLVSKIEVFRIKQKDQFTKLKNETQKKLDIVNTPALDDKNIASKALGNPADYFVLVYATAGTAVFASQALFYIAGILLILLLLRFIVNRFF